jgi:hypothetical protein
MARRWEGRLAVVFEGWDDDPREVTEIPAVRRYFAAPTDAWPYWLHFAEKVGDTLARMLRLCCRGRIEAVERNLVGWRFSDLGEVKREVERQTVAMNRLYAELGLPEAMRARVSEEVGQLLENALHWRGVIQRCAGGLGDRRSSHSDRSQRLQSANCGHWRSVTSRLQRNRNRPLELPTYPDAVGFSGGLGEDTNGPILTGRMVIRPLSRAPPTSRRVTMNN